MLNIIRERLRQGRRTIAYPAGDPPPLPDRFRGLPVLDESRCPDGCSQLRCRVSDRRHHAGPRRAFSWTWVAASFAPIAPLRVRRMPSDLPATTVWPSRPAKTWFSESGQGLKLAQSLEPRMRRIFGRSLKLRQVSAGGDNAAEADLNVLGTVVFDMGRFGIQFVASPRHADGLVVTGPVTENMKLALRKTYDAVPPPKIVIAVGACRDLRRHLPRPSRG